MNRRDFLTAAGAVSFAALAPEAAFAAAAAPWTLGWADVEGDLEPRRLRRVHGRAPVDLRGVLYRNGPAKFRRAGASATHWFDGDGLMRRFAVEDGEATLSARFVDTPKRRADAAADAVITPGFGTPSGPGARIGGPDDANAANTAVLPIGDDVWALWEGGSPFRMDGRSLRTRGPVTLGENLGGMPFLAHPRRDVDGTIWNLGMNGAACIVWKLSADGVLQSATPVTLPRASYLHDFTATDRHLILVLQPWLFAASRPPFVNTLAWRPEEGVQVLVLDKADLTRRRVFELPAFSFFHLGSAWNDGEDIRFDVCAATDPSFAVRGARDVLLGRRPDPAGAAELAGVVLRANGRAEMTRTGRKAEFPQSDPRRAGLSRRLTAHVCEPARSDAFTGAVAVRDWSTGHEDRYDFGPDHLTEELLFVPKPGRTAESDAWLIGTTLNLRARATELHVFEAARVAAGPLVTWRADVPLPLGFHGAWGPT